MFKSLKFVEYFLELANTYFHEKYSESDAKKVYLDFETHLIVVMSTGILMWIYAILGHTSFSTPVVAYVGISASLIHLLSPIVFLWTRNVYITSAFLLVPGIVHQSTFAFYSGGPSSDILLWFSVLPLIAGILSNIACVLVWFLICSLTSLGFLILESNGYSFPMAISNEGYFIARNILIFGYLFLSTILIAAYLKMEANAKKKMESKNEKVHNLLRILLHDISTPISIIKNSSKKIKKYMSETIEDQSYQKLVNSISIIENILTSVRQMYAVDIGKTQLKMKPYCMKEARQFIEFMFEQKLKQKNVSINFNFNDCEDKLVFVDKVIFQNQILANIVSNAIKFSHDGGTIDIEATQCPSHIDRMNIRISDRGVGMNSELIQNLFDAKMATSRLGTSGEKGTGLGMVIVKSLLDKMGGKIEVQSIEDVGTTFILSVPIFEDSQLNDERDAA